jgi:hypothetical protein
MQKPGTPSTTIVPAGTVATATNTPATVVNAGNYGNAVAYLNVSAASGTTPSMTVKFQDGPTKTGPFVDIPSGAFTAVTTTGTSRVALSNVGPYIQAVETITGTTPSFTHSLTICGIGG